MLNWKEELAFRLLAARGTESQAEVAARAGISDRTIGLIETKKIKKPPCPQTLARLALATGSDPVEWLSIIHQAIAPDEIELLRKKMPERLIQRQFHITISLDSITLIVLKDLADAIRSKT